MTRSLLLGVSVALLLAATVETAQAGWFDGWNGIGRYWGYGISDGYHAKPRFRAGTAQPYPTYEPGMWHDAQPATPPLRARWSAPAPVPTPAVPSAAATPRAPRWSQRANRAAAGQGTDLQVPEVEGPQPTLAQPEINGPEFP